MKFPIHIQDEPQLNRIIHAISKHTVEQTVTEVLTKLGVISEFLTKQECGIEMKSHYRIDQAIKKGELRFVAKGRNRMISRTEFNNWKQEDSLL